MLLPSCHRFLGNAQVLLVTLYCFLQVVEISITHSEEAIGTSLSIPVTDFLGIAQGLLVARRRGFHERRWCLNRHFLFLLCHRLPWQCSGVSCGTPLLVQLHHGWDKQRRERNRLCLPIPCYHRSWQWSTLLLDGSRQPRDNLRRESHKYIPLPYFHRLPWQCSGLFHGTLLLVGCRLAIYNQC